jgi:hypothetical protein
MNWKVLLAKKYTSFKEIQRYRDFLIKRNDQGKVVVYHKSCFYRGEYIDKNILKKDVENLDLKEEAKNFTYELRGMSPDLSKEKVADLVKMYDKFIDPILRPEWLPVSQSVTTPDISITSPSSGLAQQHRAALKKRNKAVAKNVIQKKCT